MVFLMFLNIVKKNSFLDIPGGLPGGCEASHVSTKSVFLIFRFSMTCKGKGTQDIENMGGILTLFFIS